jgi:hypothetical protein
VAGAVVEAAAGAVVEVLVVEVVVVEVVVVEEVVEEVVAEGVAEVQPRQDPSALSGRSRQAPGRTRPWR